MAVQQPRRWVDLPTAERERRQWLSQADRTWAAAAAAGETERRHRQSQSNRDRSCARGADAHEEAMYGSAHKPVTAPSRREVTAWWRDLLDGRCSREETFERVRPWVEDPPEAIDDPITSMGLQHLHGFGLTAEGRAGYLHDDQEIRAAFEQWLTHGTRFDADPVGWQRDRYSQALKAVLRDQGQQHAQALAKRLVAAAWLSAGDVTQILCSTTTELPHQDHS